MIGVAFLPELIVSALVVLGGAFALIGSWGLVCSTRVDGRGGGAGGV
jgi:hypothetical protein